MDFFKYGSYFKRILFIVIAGTIFFSLGIVYVAYRISFDLTEKSRSHTEIFAKFTTTAADTTGDTSQLLDLIYEEIVQKIDFPVILTDSANNPQAWSGLDIPEGTSPYGLSDKNVEKLKEITAAMDQLNQPVFIKMKNGEILNIVHFGESFLQKAIKILPIFLISFFISFILLLTIVMYLLHNQEKNFIWRGLAKETAHQLGTPISAIMGWLTLLETEEEDREHLELIENIDQDVKKLKRIADRFSQIGSIPELKEIDIINTITEVIVYYSKRIPSSKKINIDFVCNVDFITESESLMIKGNKDLLTWAFENLIKNSIDAIHEKSGNINFRVLKSKDEQHIIIRVSDDGIGITSKNRKNIFMAGFTTKKRGWGVGLALTKRIIEEYHEGKIKLVETSKDNGTTFEIQLKTAKSIENHLSQSDKN